MNTSAVERRLPGPIGSAIEYVPTVASTNDYLFGLESCANGAVVVTDLQTAGRGRGANRWHAPAGENLLFSFLLQMHTSDSTLLLLPVLTSLAACEAIDALGVLGTQAKWPNDVVSQDKKLGGILIESRVSGKSARVVVGIGLNVNQRRFPSDLRESATSIALMSGATVEREKLLGLILDALNHTVFAMEHGEAVHLYTARCSTVGQDIGFDAPGGRRFGRAVGLDSIGRLLIDEGGSVRAYSGSEVTHLRPGVHY